MLLMRSLVCLNQRSAEKLFQDCSSTSGSRGMFMARYLQKQIASSLPMPIEKKCETCGTSRWLTPSAAKRGEGRFCSRACTDHAGMARVPLEKRFWKKVQLGDPLSCWLWSGTRNENGYGITAITVNGH